MHETCRDEERKVTLMKERDVARKRYREHLGAGIGLGLMSLGAAAVGAVCPLCVIAVPTMVGSGLYQRHKERRRERALRELCRASDEDVASRESSPVPMLSVTGRS